VFDDSSVATHQVPVNFQFSDSGAYYGLI